MARSGPGVLLRGFGRSSSRLGIMATGKEAWQLLTSSCEGFCWFVLDMLGTCTSVPRLECRAVGFYFAPRPGRSACSRPRGCAAAWRLHHGLPKIPRLMPHSCELTPHSCELMLDSCELMLGSCEVMSSFCGRSLACRRLLCSSASRRPARPRSRLCEVAKGRALQPPPLGGGSRGSFWTHVSCSSPS